MHSQASKYHSDEHSQKSQIQFCIDAFVAEAGYISEGACFLLAPTELTPDLEQLVANMPAASGWRAWVEGPRVWFMEGRLLDVTNNSLIRPTVHIIFRDQEGRPLVGGAWRRVAPARWDLLQFSGEDSIAFENNKNACECDPQVVTR